MSLPCGITMGVPPCTICMKSRLAHCHRDMVQNKRNELYDIGK